MPEEQPPEPPPSREEWAIRKALGTEGPYQKSPLDELVERESALRREQLRRERELRDRGLKKWWWRVFYDLRWRFEGLAKRTAWRMVGKDSKAIESASPKSALSGTKPPKKPDFGMFVGIIGLAAAFLVPILQANGVDVNWIASAIAYLVIIAVCLWSFLAHAVPHCTKMIRSAGALILVAVIGFLAIYATRKQYRREHPIIAVPLQIASLAPSPPPSPTPVPVVSPAEPKAKLDLGPDLLSVKEAFDLQSKTNELSKAQEEIDNKKTINKAVYKYKKLFDNITSF